MSKKIDNTKLILIIAIIVVVIIAVYIISVGQVNLSNGNPLPAEFKDSKEEAKRKHNLLKLEIQSDEILYNKLQRRFRRIYFLVRLCFVVLWFGLLFILWKLNLVKDVSTAIDYSQAILILFLIFNFLTFGSITNLDAFLRTIRIKLENWEWRKNKHLIIQLNIKKIEITILENIIANE